MNIKIMEVSDVVFPQGKVKELKYYYRHREEILAKKRVVGTLRAALQRWPPHTPAPMYQVERGGV